MNEYSEEEVPLQTLTLDHPDNVAVFTEDGRVFFDLGFLVLSYNKVIDQNVEHCVEHGCLDQTKTAYLKGQEDVVNAILRQAQSLALEYHFQFTTAE